MLLLKLNASLPVPVEQEQIVEIVQWLIGLAGVYIFGQSAVDAVEAKGGDKT